MGTVARNITQTVSFYNTTGVIEKEHNLYYCPSLTGNTIPASWLSAFNTVCSPSSSYSAISISQWQPEDRVLSIKGRIEDFRNVRHGILNYCIVTQTVTDEQEVSKTYYYAFFITGAKQNGIGAVTLDLEPDHFTNVFYLQNSDSVTIANNLFNNKLKNTYVERQHYDRIEHYDDGEEGETRNFQDETDGQGVVHVLFRVDKSSFSGTITSISAEITDCTLIDDTSIQWRDDDQWVVTDYGDYYIFSNHISTTQEQGTQLKYEVDITARISGIRVVNYPIFANYEETFRFRRQFRDYKKRVVEPLTDEEEAYVKNGISWINMSDTLKYKILKQCIAIYHCTLKNNKLIIPYEEAGGYVHRGNFLCYPYSAISKQMPDIFNINCVIPEKFLRYKNNILPIFKYFAIRDKSSDRLFVTFNAMVQITERDKYPDYIASCFISKDDEVLTHITFEEVYKPGTSDTVFCPVINDVVTTLGASDSDSPIGGKMVDGLNMVVLPPSERVEDALAENVSYRIGTTVTGRFDVTLHINETTSPNCFIYLFNSVNKQTFNLNLEDKCKNTKTNYFEPVLTFAPYSFYTISYLGNIEVPLNKNSYYQNPNIKLDYIISITESMKVSVIPNYTIEGNDYKYYSDSLTLTLNNELVFASEVLDQYLIQNKAQMKNQYAINDTNLAKNIGTSTLSGLATGFGTGMMTGNPVIGVASGIAGATVGAIGSAITWSINDKEIAMNQKAKIADVGSLPNNLKQTGTDIATDTAIGEMGLYLNHYKIDEMSYNNICKYLERYGYLINIYDTINAFGRKGWNYVKLVDFELDTYLSEAQEESIRQIFSNGVTLLHEPSYLHNNSVHNYETILD